MTNPKDPPKEKPQADPLKIEGNIKNKEDKEKDKKEGDKKGNKKTMKKFVKIVIPVLILLMLISAIGVISYLYYKKYNDYKSLYDEKIRVQNQLEEEKNKTAVDYEDQIEELNSDIDTLTDEKDVLNTEKEALEEDKTELESSVSSYQTKQANISKYVNFLDYVYYVVGVHGGFSGLTEAEYQTARSKAQATGNANLVSAVDSAWNDTEVDQMVRFLNVITTAQNGIKANL